MPVLLNPKHELFAQALAKGKAADEAYELAGYRPSRSNASVLRTNQNISARLAELQTKSAAKVEITAETLVAELEEARALAAENKQSAAMVQASIGKAKLLGLIVEKREDVTPRRNRDQTIKRLTDILERREPGGSGGSVGRVGEDREGNAAFPTIPGHGTA